MSNDILDKPTNRMLLRMSVPVSLGMLSTMLFQVIDTYFVGTLGAEPLMALGFASTTYFLLIGLLIGIGIGASVLVGKHLGAEDEVSAKRAGTVALSVTFAIGVLVSGAVVLFHDQIFAFLGASTAVIAYIRAYMVPLMIGIPLIGVGIAGSSILRANGNIGKPELIFGIAGVINLVLDYAFIYGKFGLPALGIQGVAIGTVISWAFIFISMMFLLFKDRLVMWIGKGLDENVTALKEIYQMGAPAILTQLIGPFTLMFITFLLGQLSAEAVAAFGVAGRIETLMMIGIMGVSTASTPFIAQNFGAKNKQRIDEAIVFGGKASIYLGLGLIVILLPFIERIAMLFSEDMQIINYTTTYFYLVGASYVFYSLYLVTAAIFNGLQLPQKSLRIMLVKTLVFTVPFTMIGSWSYGVEGVFIGLSVSNVAGGLYAGFEMRKDLKNADSSLVGRSALLDITTDLKLLFKRS